MAYFDKNSRKKQHSRSDGSKYKRPMESYSDSNNRTLNTANCSACGDSCQIPFKPIAGKPVFCNACFRKNDNPSRPQKNSRFNSRTDSIRQNYSPETTTQSSELSEINAKLDKILKLIQEL